MAVVICMLRGVNVTGNNLIKMAELKALCVSIKLKDAQTFIQSGNVIFSTDEKDLAKVTKRIQDAIEKKFGFRPGVILRTAAELRRVIKKNPFAAREGIEPSNLLVIFWADEPAKEACQRAQAVKTAPEEVHLIGGEAFIYFQEGQGRSKLRWQLIERAVGTFGTGRNWNSVTKMLAIAEAMEAAQ